MVKLILIEGLNLGFVSTLAEYKPFTYSTIIPINSANKGYHLLFLMA